MQCFSLRTRVWVSLKQVVDETDRMLRQAYQDWLPAVLAAVQVGSTGRNQFGNMGPVKILASATLTHDPAKLDRLKLRAPRYVAMSSSDKRYECCIFSGKLPTAGLVLSLFQQFEMKELLSNVLLES